MGTDSKEAHREDVFDSYQGASSLTLLKKISIAAIAIALVAFFLFWSQSTDEKSASQDASGISLKDRVTALEEEVAKLKQGTKNLNEVSNGDVATKTIVAQDQIVPAQPTQPESINLKSLFEEELKASTPVAQAHDDSNTTEPKETQPSKAQTQTKSAPKTAPKKTAGKSTVYVVKRGDTLSKISLKFYGSSHKWQRIVEANKSILGANNTLRVGMKLTVPMDE